MHLKTDSRFLYNYTLSVCKVNGLEVLACTDDLYGTGGGTGRSFGMIAPEVREVKTFYEGMFLEQGYPINYMAFRIDHDGPFAAPRDPEDFDSVYWRSVEGPRVLFGRDTAETRRQKLKK